MWCYILLKQFKCTLRTANVTQMGLYIERNVISLAFNIPSIMYVMPVFCYADVYMSIIQTDCQTTQHQNTFYVHTMTTSQSKASSVSTS